MSEDVWTVGALARLVGVSPDSIRHYERIGILPKAARSRAGHRRWPRRDVEYMKWVGPARRAGFTLRELARVFQMYRTGVAPCGTVRELPFGGCVGGPRLGVEYHRDAGLVVHKR